MERSDCAILLNTCPEYFYLLEANLGLKKRYASKCKWPTFLATEIPIHNTIVYVSKVYDVRILKLSESDADFLHSRLAGIRALPRNIQYVLPLQDDFLLERPGINEKALEEALDILDRDRNVLSLRLMPCPFTLSQTSYNKNWKQLQQNDILFSYQATLWRREVYEQFLQRLILQIQEENEDLKPGSAEWNHYCIYSNPAESFIGRMLMQTLFPSGIHLCWNRAGTWANAVYHSPWPYRPTAVVKGTLEPWARELMQREGFALPF
jgi:hypothetical protein